MGARIAERGHAHGSECVLVEHADDRVVDQVDAVREQSQPEGEAVRQAREAHRGETARMYQCEHAGDAGPEEEIHPEETSDDPLRALDGQRTSTKERNADERKGRQRTTQTLRPTAASK